MFITGTVTWYAKQRYTNPFASHSYINLTGTHDYMYIRCYEKARNSERNTLLFFLPLDEVDTGRTSPITTTETGTLVTLEVLRSMEGVIKPPPLNWRILCKSSICDTISSIPASWPKPSFSEDVSGIKDVTMGMVYPFSDSLSALFLSYKHITMLVITDTLSLASVSEIKRGTLFKEKFDIIISIALEKPQVLAIRDLLRPQYCISLRASPKTPDTVHVPSNILYPQSEDFTYTVFRDTRKQLHIQQQ